MEIVLAMAKVRVTERTLLLHNQKFMGRIFLFPLPLKCFCLYSSFTTQFVFIGTDIILKINELLVSPKFIGKNVKA